MPAYKIASLVRLLKKSGALVKVIQTKKSVTLEPMTSRDRRIVHLTLESNNNVLTESTGEGFSRKITVYPANEK